MPAPDDVDIATYLKRTTPTSSKPAEWDSFNYWSNTPKFAVSFLKAMYGDAARKENDWAFHYLPKIDRNYSWVEIWDSMYTGRVKGLMTFGMNGVQIGPNSKKNIDALKKADWLVVGELYPDETSEFWRAPGTTPDEMKAIQTTVYRLPCAGFAEKDGTFVNSARWLQWKNAALPPPGPGPAGSGHPRADLPPDSGSVSAKMAASFPIRFSSCAGRTRSPITRRSPRWRGRSAGRRSPTSPIPSGLPIKAGQQLPGFAALKDDGTHAVGQLVVLRLVDRGGQSEPLAETPTIRPGSASIRNWAWSWPANRRVMYNRASCDLAGKPWDPERRQVWWDEAKGRWVGNDVPDFKADSKPGDHMGPFIMNAEGVGRIFGPLAAFADGPFPEHYEPVESPILNPLHPQQSNNPVVKRFNTPLDKYGEPSQGFTVVCTTYRLTEHYHYWTKNNPMNVELVPEPFVEIPHDLANDLGIKGGDRVKVTSARGQLHRQSDGHWTDQADDDRRQEDLSDRHPDSLGLSRHRRGRRTDREKRREPAVADRRRSECLHA